MDTNTAQSVVGLPPRLGTPVPGTVGGLPAQGGLSVLQNPMAKQLQSMGRGQDSMLVHMTPGEVQGLQQLAMAAGGSLTINPHTGLPEAGWLGKLLPTILGAVLTPLTMGAINPMTAGLLVGAGTGIVKGDLKAGLMAGLQAFGGASLGSALAGTGAAGAAGAGAGTSTLNIGSTAGGITTPALSSGVNLPASVAQAGRAAATFNPGAISLGGTSLAPAVTTGGLNLGSPAGLLVPNAAAAAPSAGGVLSGITRMLPQPVQQFGQDFATASRTIKPGTVLSGGKGVLYKYAPYAAGLGLLSGLSSAMEPKTSGGLPQQQNKYPYLGPYVSRRQLRMPTEEERQNMGTGEFQYFNPTISQPVPVSSLSEEERKQYGFAEGGEAASDDSGVYAMEAPAAARAAPTYTVFGGMGPESAGMGGGLDALAAYYDTSPQGVVRALEPGNIGRSLYNVPGAAEKNYGTAGLGALSTTPVYIPQTGQTVPASNYSQFAKGYWGVNNVPYGQLPNGQYFFGNDVISEADYNGMIGGGATHTTPTAPPKPVAPSDPVWDQYLAMYPDVAAEAKNHPNMTPEQYAASHYAEFGQKEGRTLTGTPTTPPPAATATATATTAPPATATTAPENPYGIDISAYSPAAATTSTTPPLSQEAIDRYLSGIDWANLNFNLARGGSVNMRDGSFVVDARTVSELGNGSSNAGKEILARMGGRPLDGPGDGVSDSIPARIGSRQAARVARDEVIMPPEVVNRLGKGSPQRGADKLYALMDRAHQARRKAKRGQDTNLRRGLV